MLTQQKMFVLSLAAAAGLLFATGAGAQTATNSPQPRQPGGRLNLTQAQRDEIRSLREAQRKELEPLRGKLRAARQQLSEAMRADVPDEAAVRSAAAALGALEADQAALRARAKGQFMSVLTPEQRAQVKDARARIAQREQRMRMRLSRTMWQQYARWWRDWR